jgi:hypothetical protein
MNKAVGVAEIEELLEVEIGRNIHESKRTGAALPHQENATGETPADDLGISLRRVTERSTREIENLLDELQKLRKKLLTDGNHIQGDIAKYAELSQGVMQLTTIVSDSVKNLPSDPGIGG